MKEITKSAFYSLLESSTENILNSWSIRLCESIKFNDFNISDSFDKFARSIPDETKDIYFVFIKKYGVYSLFSFENTEKYEALEWSELLFKSFFKNLSPLYNSKYSKLEKVYIRENFQGVFDSIYPTLIQSNQHYEGISFSCSQLTGFLFIRALEESKHD